MENRTSTGLMYDSCHDKINYHFIELCFYVKVCQLYPCDCTCAGWHTANQLTSTINCAGNITYFLKTQKRHICHKRCLS